MTTRTFKGFHAPDFMTPAEVATVFRVDPKTITRWANDGRLQSIRTLGGHRRQLVDQSRQLLSESFAEVVEHSMITHAPALFARMLAEGSPLFDAGLVAPDGLRSAVARLTRSSYDEDQDGKLLEVLSLHMSAVAFLR